jgi:hypothetical protein
MTGEISFDLVAGANNEFEEGTYRLPGGEWRVFIFSKRPVNTKPRRRSCRNATGQQPWASGDGTPQQDSRVSCG